MALTGVLRPGYIQIRVIDLEAALVAKYAALSPLLNERARRLWAAAESVAIGYGGDAVVKVASTDRGEVYTIVMAKNEDGEWTIVAHSMMSRAQFDALPEEAPAE